jgi:hypothetical protein
MNLPARPADVTPATGWSISTWIALTMVSLGIGGASYGPTRDWSLNLSGMVLMKVLTWAKETGVNLVSMEGRKAAFGFADWLVGKMEGQANSLNSFAQQADEAVTMYNYAELGSSLVLGLGSEYYVHRKNFSWTRGAIYFFAAYGGIVATSTQMFRTGLAKGVTHLAKDAAAPETWQDIRDWVKSELQLMFAERPTDSAPEPSTGRTRRRWDAETGTYTFEEGPAAGGVGHAWATGRDERDYAAELVKDQLEEHGSGEDYDMAEWDDLDD